MRARRPKPRRGVLLLAVLVVVALLTIANLAYYDWSFTERRAANSASRRAQARAASDSAIELLRVWLAQEDSGLDQDGGWYDNPARFRAVLVIDSPAAELRSRASVVAPRWGSDAIEGARFGLEDDSGRLNLNTLLVAETREEGSGRAQLLALPGMTEAIADAILDWLDEDNDPRPQGAESTYYAGLDTPYAPANGPLATIEQLLLIKDVTPELLWGLDQDRGHTVSEAEAVSVALSTDNSTGDLNSGWASLLTLDSVEANTRPNGRPKINLNSNDLEQMHGELATAIGLAGANFIVAYRQGGPEDNDEDDPLGANASPQTPAGDGSSDALPGGFSLRTEDAGTLSIDFDAPASTLIASPFDLISVTVRAVEEGELTPVLVESPWREGDSLVELLDAVTTTDAASIPGRINLNQAPRPVLLGVPGMPPAAVDAILASRDPAAGATNSERRHAAWLLTSGYVDLEQMRQIAPYVTGRGAAFRAQVLGGWESGGPTVRQEVVIDRTASPPRVVRRRDLSPLGPGFDPAIVFSPEGVNTL